MKSKSTPALGLVLLLLSLASCNKDIIRGQGNISSEQRPVNNFTSVSLIGSSSVFITAGNNFGVTVKGYENLIPYFETRISNAVLELGYKNNVNVRNDNIEVYITLPKLEGLSISGSGDISSSGNFNGNTSMQFQIAGSGNIYFDQGVTENFHGLIEGSGTIHAFGLESDQAEIHSSGSGHVELTVFDQLTVYISGSGNVYYKGTPAVTAHITGSGSVIKR